MTRFVWLFLFCIAAWAQPTVGDLLEQKTVEELRRFDAGFDGVLGVTAIDLETGWSFGLHGETVFPQASVIKIPVLVRMFQAAKAGELRLGEKVTLEPKEAVGGSGRLQFALKNGPVTLTVRELVTAMGVDSDNTATNKCIDLAGGMARVNFTLDAAGFPRTRLKRKMMDSAAALRDDENISTPVEMARLVEQIYRGKIVDAESSREILDIMRRVSGGFQEGLPLDTETAVKTGQLPGARGETGIVFLEHRPFVLSVMSAYIDDRRTPVPEVTRIVYRMFEKAARSNRYGHTVR
jgi:beta-lactamase class A